MNSKPFIKAIKSSIPVAAALFASSFTAKANSIVAYVEGPGVQSSSVSNIATETFEGATPGIYTNSFSSSIGAYQGTGESKFAIVRADQYGGAGGTGNYFAVGAESHSADPVRLTLSSEANYFGFWWSAGDRNNSITFLQDGVALATFTTADLVTLLPNTPSGLVTAINGQTYATQDYYGNPNSHNDTNEAFGYVDIIANGLYFNQIDFGNNGSTGTGFESDNHSVAANVLAPPDGDVVVQDVPLTEAAMAPEPNTVVFLLTALGGGLAWRRVRRP